MALRSIAAVIIGYLVFAVSAVALFRLSGRDPAALQPPSFVVLSVLYGMFFAALGGYIAAAIARRNELLHAGIVAGVLALLAGFSMVAQPGQASVWSQVAAVGLMAPSALGGGLARRRRSRYRACR